MYPSLPNNTWHAIQHVPLGHRGAHFATFSDPWLRARNVYFDFRFFREKELWKRPFLFFDGPHGGEKALALEAAKQQISGSNFDFLSCPGDPSNSYNYNTSNSGNRRVGTAVCLGNCMPCNGEVTLFSESCSMSVLRQLGATAEELQREERRQSLARAALSKWALEVGAQGSFSFMGNDVGCDELLDGEGESCIRTSKHTDHDTCKEHGLDMVVRSLEHWKLF